MMRRFVSVLVAAVLLLIPTGPAAATTPAKVQAAAARMQALGLVKPVDSAGQDLGLNVNLTRAQMVVILVRAFGQSANAQYLKGAAAFPDTVNHWASGEIAMAKNLVAERSNGKEAIGQPDGTFNPDGNVTAAEALAYIMKFVGAPQDETEAWPNNYISGGLQAGLITAEDQAVLAGIKNAPATRGLFYYLADSAFYSYVLPEGKPVYQMFVDNTIPTIVLDSYPSEVREASVTISGQVSERGSLMAGDRPVSLDDNGRFAFDLAVAEGSNTVTFVATDVAGNPSAPVAATLVRTAAPKLSQEAMQESANRLLSFGLIQALTDENLMLDAAMTRAELAVLMVRAFGKEAEAKQLTGSAAFPDTAGHWASGYIAMADALAKDHGGGAIGMPDGSFLPEGEVSVATAVQFLGSFLGVQPDTTEAWPDNYFNPALKGGVVSADDYELLMASWNASATRGLVYYLADRAFHDFPLPGGKTVYAALAQAPAAPDAIAATLGNGHVPVAHAKKLRVTFTAAGQPVAAPPAFTVTVDPRLGAYDPATGLFTAGADVGEGVLIVEAEGGLKAEVPVTVFNEFRLLLSPNNRFVRPGDLVRLKARIVDYLGHAKPIEQIEWSATAGTLGESSLLTVPDMKGLLTVQARVGDQTATAALWVAGGIPAIEADVPDQLETGESVRIHVSVMQDGEEVSLPVRVETTIGTWDDETHTLTAPSTPGSGSFRVFVGGWGREYEVEVVGEAPAAP